MNEDNFMLVSLNDEKSKAIAEVLASLTCKKIINYLAEHKEASQKDFSDKIHLPMNTIDYNMKKLLHAGFVQKRKNFFWSAKGKKIAMYELSNKSVVISHKKSVSDKIKSIVPAFILTVAGTAAIWTYDKISLVARDSGTFMQKSTESYASAIAPAASGAASNAVTGVAYTSANIISSQPAGLWFLFGGLVAIFIIAVLNWRKL